MSITIPIEIGDVILSGKFKNHKVTVKEIGLDDYGLPTINGKGIMKIRLEKLLPKKVEEKTMRKINQKDYKFYLVKNGKIIEGFEYREDAIDRRDNDLDNKNGVKVLTKQYCIQNGMNPDDNSSWENQLKTESKVSINEVLKPSSLKAIDNKIEWAAHETLPIIPGENIKHLIKTYKIPAKEWGYSGNYIGIKTKKQKIFWKDNGSEMSFLGILNLDGTIPESIIKESTNLKVVQGLKHYINLYSTSNKNLYAELGRNILKAYEGGRNLKDLIKAVETDMARPGTKAGYEDYLKVLKSGLTEVKKNSKMKLSEVISKGVFVTIKKEDGKFWFYIDTVDGPECISNVGFPTKEAAEHAALTKGFNVEKGGNAEDELPKTVEVPKPDKREKTPDTEKPKEIDLGKEKEIKLEEQLKRMIREEIKKVKQAYQKKKSITEATTVSKKVEEGLRQLKELQSKISDAKAQIDAIMKNTDLKNLEKTADKLLKEDLWSFFEELKKDDQRIVDLQDIVMTVNRFQASPATYNYEKVLDYAMTLVNQDVKLKILEELKACETLGKTKGSVSFTQVEGVGDVWNSIVNYFKKLIPSLQSKGKKIDNSIVKLQKITSKIK